MDEIFIHTCISFKSISSEIIPQINFTGPADHVDNSTLVLVP